ncbi:hypothetical protein EYZ11_005855 [Aspergillus tanneri]|uniref:pH-response regulator protein palC n=1 Tax=Aspergillus tanneri TaxID=1220188 RepID=A0A4S3JHD9_9EURO|nr:uncharacterized protein ATNIH1004_004243 [Aspergillus tanneri]KAA8648358.1 hypothetical protein ATNIH1004_004243 [Aspergillus tanneri]THC94670.1 hypothetical protein EYZ11_005855 [Aspergillus tanneri]
MFTTTSTSTITKLPTMVYSFVLPTTSHLSFQKFISSSTHPSLPQAATTARHALRIALKTHKRLPRGTQRDSHFPSIVNAAYAYIPYLQAISNGLNGTPIQPNNSSEVIEITQHAEIECEWRATLTSVALMKISHPTASRVRIQGINSELAFVLTTLAYALSGLASVTVNRTVYSTTTPSAEQRTTAIQESMKYLLQAASVHSLLGSSPALVSVSRPILDLDPATQASLSSLALAEATLLAVFKDDCYITACIQARNPNDKDWMVRAPEMPKVRAPLFARLCIRAAEYAEQAGAGMCAAGAEGKFLVSEDLVNYTDKLRVVARARACRFFGIDAELAGKIGEGISWLQAAREWSGLTGIGWTRQYAQRMRVGKEGPGMLSKLKQGWMDRREEMHPGSDKAELSLGDSSGRDEEGRVIEMLEAKWTRMNDTVFSPSPSVEGDCNQQGEILMCSQINTQLVPPFNDLVSKLPSGRDIVSPPVPYQLSPLDEEELAHMRAPPAEDEFKSSSDVDDSDDEPSAARDTPGTVPSRSTSAYY